MTPQHSILVSEYLRQREALLAAFPELTEDVQALADTLEGETAAPDVIASFIRAAREDEAMAGALTTMIREHQDRRSRLEARADKRRAAAQAIMEACHLRKVELPDFTASISAGRRKVIITDEFAIPDDFCETERRPRKTDIKVALEDGADVPGAALSNAEPVLMVRVK